MTDATKTFRPDYAPHPGQLLEEILQTHEISARELARRCGRSAKLITEIILGKATLEPETALQFERVLDVEASIWLGLEAAYRLHLARQQDRATLSESIRWASSFPLKELCQRGIVTGAKATAETVRELLRFFGVASVGACTEYCNSIGVSYRHSPTFDSDRDSLFAWLRIGELEAERTQCTEFDRAKLLVALQEIRALTTIGDTKVFMPKVKALLAGAGVVFIIVRPFSKMALSGISRWLSPRKALIQQTVRHLSNDHFWFTLFHESAHILLHSRKAVFVDGRDASGTAEEEDEANKWATEFLIPRQAFTRFCGAAIFSDHSVTAFAREQGVAPGIVVGQLQKAGVIPYSALNKLKVRFAWKE